MPDRERGRVGAPPGLFVHWLNLELFGEFTRAYKLSYIPGNIITDTRDIEKGRSLTNF